MFSPKRFLQENLSLSTKLFLKEWWATIARGSSVMIDVPWSFMRRVATRLNVPLLAIRFEAEVPAPPPIDYQSSFAELAGKTPAGAGREVIASIIIPVYNKAAYSFQCLRSLTREINFAHTEIIVVDNGSTDETSIVLSHFGGVIRTTRNEANRGFVEACNQGAAIARGKYLVFLNNDAVVLPGWLKHLVETIERDQSIGAVGSMFLYPDGRIQEAGAIVWKNGEAHHYGWRASPDDRRFNFAREVDYCSAASLLVRKDLFDRLGGFDLRFAPAYYEDIDLCFGVRSLGFKVIYQPMSRVIHYEGATAGRDVSKSFKQYQILNREKFVDKWREVLDREHAEKDLKRVEEAAQRDQRPQILVADERPPSFDRDAGSARMYFILKTLASSYRVVFLPFNRPQKIAYEEALWKIGIQTGDAADYRRLLKDRRFAAAVLSRPTVAEALIPRINRRAPDVKIVLDMVDAYFVRLEREYAINQDPQTLQQAEHYRKVETRLARASHLIWCNSSEDKRVMEREAPGKRIEVITTIHEVHEGGKSFAGRRELLFVGNMAHRPNADAVEFFVREIFPAVAPRLPDVKLYVVGDHAGALAALASERVVMTGFVSDLERYLESCRVFVAPLRFGAGTKGKVGEAMSYGLPVVTTTIAAEGFDLAHEVNAMIRDEPAAFAECVVRLYTEEDLWEKLSANSRRHIANHFSSASMAEVIRSSMRDLIADRDDG